MGANCQALIFHHAGLYTHEPGPPPTRIKAMLTDKEREKLRETLEGERQRLLRNAQDGLAFSMNRERNIGRDSIDESMEEELFSTELGLRDREKFVLNKINGALARVGEGTIDEAGSGGEPIGF